MVERTKNEHARILMGDTEKAIISALYFVRGWGQDFRISTGVGNAHIKVLEDRIKMGNERTN